jgi:acetyl esterase/lipase
VPTMTTESHATPPTLADVPYGAHERQALDWWRTDAPGPNPLLFHIHGGGWVQGDKREVRHLDRYLAAGISVVSINYRLTTQAQIAQVHPPVCWPLQDCARALQFVRSKAEEWSIDRRRIAASGESAGACSSLWLALHDDLADPHSDDPIARESTRLCCAAVNQAQVTLDPVDMKQWVPNSRYGGHAFGFMPDPRDLGTRDLGFAPFLSARERLRPLIREYSPLEHVRAGAPPIYMIYNNPPDPGRPQGDPTHSADFGVKLQERLHSVGADCELVYPGATGVRHPSLAEYLIARLRVGSLAAAP